MTTESDFQAALGAQPDAHHLRLVFADWLQERDDPRAEGYRALGVLGLYPWKFDDDRWLWCSERSEDGGDPDYCLLPDDWFDLLSQGHRFAAGFSTRREAEDAAALAFARLPAGRRTELLAGSTQEAASR